MNAISIFGRRTFGGWLALVAVLLATGCATHRIDWGSRIGTYTFDYAVQEFGPPDKQAKLQDGTVIAEWLTHRGGTYVYPAYGYGNYPYWYATPPTPTYMDSPDFYLRLTFGTDGKLQSWKKFAK
ncbi:MAG TPA: hypothetical protein VK327_05800 [Candidatus Paceibacterota bacterium]|nr:hypothetical protein [Candidatus Paceibacterota bacterium]